MLKNLSNSPLGFGFPTALGVKVGNPEKHVVSITGDGGFMFGVQELAAAVQYDIGFVTVVFNNNSFGNVLRDQRERFTSAYGAELKNPDFVKLAESFGALGLRAHSPDDLRRALERGLGGKMKPGFWRAFAGSSLISLSFAAVPSEASARVVVSGDP